MSTYILSSLLLALFSNDDISPAKCWLTHSSIVCRFSKNIKIFTLWSVPSRTNKNIFYVAMCCFSPSLFVTSSSFHIWTVTLKRFFVSLSNFHPTFTVLLAPIVLVFGGFAVSSTHIQPWMVLQLLGAAAVMSLWKYFLNTSQQHWMKLKTHKSCYTERKREHGSRKHECCWCSLVAGMSVLTLAV